MTLAPDDDTITKATKALGAADPVNKSFSERMKMFKNVDVEAGAEEEGALDQGQEEEAME